MHFMKNALSKRVFFRIAASFGKSMGLRLFLYIKGDEKMETRIAVIGIIIENTDSVDKLNALLHDYSRYIIGRMGLPYRQKNVNVVSIAIDAPQDETASLTGKIGKLEGVSVKTAYSNVITTEK